MCLISIDSQPWEDAMVEIIEILREKHRNIEKLLRVMEQELSVFDRGERPDYEIFGAIIEFFKKYPDSCHHPKEDIITRNLRLVILVEQRQLLTLKLSIEKVQCDCAVLLKLSTAF
jgi:hemerythrin-like domain-containing protein